jgi:hypothetical protein
MILFATSKHGREGLGNSCSLQNLTLSSLNLNLSTLIWKLLVWIFHDNCIFVCIRFAWYAFLWIIKSWLVVCIRFYEPSICRLPTKKIYSCIQNLEKGYLNKRIISPVIATYWQRKTTFFSSIALNIDLWCTKLASSSCSRCMNTQCNCCPLALNCRLIEEIWTTTCLYETESSFGINLHWCLLHSNWESVALF